MVLSKLYDCCAVGRPVIVSAAGETSRLATEAAAGLSIPPGDAVGLASAVRGLRDDNALRERLSAGARAFGEANSRERGVTEYRACPAPCGGYTSGACVPFRTGTILGDMRRTRTILLTR